MQNRFLRLTFGLSISALLSSMTVYAESKPKLKICVNNTTGAIVAKSKCSKVEKVLSLDTIKSSVATIKGEAGPKGDTGAIGATGPKGEPGQAGVLGLGSTLPSGLTIFGYIELDSHTTGIGADFRASASLPAPAPQIFGDSNVVVVNNNFVNNGCGGMSCLTPSELALTVLCTGSAEVPTAPAGFVCVYPKGRVNFTSIQGTSDNQFGFFVSGNTANAGDVFFRATWAYTVP